MVDFHKQKQQETNQNNSQNDPRNAKSVSREKLYIKIKIFIF